MIIDRETRWRKRTDSSLNPKQTNSEPIVKRVQKPRESEREEEEMIKV